MIFGSLRELFNTDAPPASPSPCFSFPEQVGNFLFQQNMDKVEMKTHFALWSVMGSPLILGEDGNQNPVLYTVQRTDHAVYIVA